MVFFFFCQVTTIVSFLFVVFVFCFLMLGWAWGGGGGGGGLLSKNNNKG